MYSYRDSKKVVHVLDECNVVRIGGKGSVCDNAHSGGCFVAVNRDGQVGCKCYRVKDAEIRNLQDEVGIDSFSVPSYDKTRKFVLELHSRVPMFDFVGWDIVITPDEEPLLMEFNVTAAPDLFQMAHGPLPSSILDDIMQRVSTVQKKFVCESQSVFSNGSHFNGGMGYY